MRTEAGGSHGHWSRWHLQYDDENSSLSKRLAVVRSRLSAAVDSSPEGPIHLLSMCSGEGRDVIGVLRDHPRRQEVSALLVEQDPDLALRAQQAARGAGLDTVEVLCADGSTTDAYSRIVPVGIALVCGVFGNISSDDVRTTIEELPSLLSGDATVIWTRHRRPPDMTPKIRSWFKVAGFVEVGFDFEEPLRFGVGTNRLLVEPREFRRGRQMFKFVGNGDAAPL